MNNDMPKITKDMLAKNPDGIARIRIRVTLPIMNNDNDRFYDKTFKISNVKALGSMMGYIQAITDCGGSIELSD